MLKNKLYDAKVRFDALFEAWDKKPHYARKNSKNPDRLEYYLLTETMPNIPYDELSPHIIITEDNITIYSRYYCNGILYNGVWLSDTTITEILQHNIDKLDLILYRRLLKRYESRLGWIDSDRKLTPEEKAEEKVVLEQEISELKLLLKQYADMQLQEKNHKNKKPKRKWGIKLRKSA